MQQPPSGPAEAVRSLDRGDAIYVDVCRRMRTLQDLDECQGAFEEAKRDLVQTWRDLERSRMYYYETEGPTLSTLRMLVHTFFGSLRTVRIPLRDAVTPADRCHYLVYPETANNQMRTLTELYRNVEAGRQRFWSHIRDGHTLKTHCLQVTSKLYEICRQSKRFTAPTASADPTAREYHHDYANLRPQDEPRPPEIDTDMGRMLDLLIKLKLSNL